MIFQDTDRLQAEERAYRAERRIDALRAALEQAAHMKSIKGARAVIRDALDEDDRVRGKRRE